MLWLALLCLLAATALAGLILKFGFAVSALREDVIEEETIRAEAARLARADRHIEGVQKFSRGAWRVGNGLVRSLSSQIAKASARRGVSGESPAALSEEGAVAEDRDAAVPPAAPSERDAGSLLTGTATSDASEAKLSSRKPADPDAS